MPTDSKSKHSIFISYSHNDEAFVRDVVRELTRAGISVSFDKMELLQVGDILPQRLKDAIDRHEYLGIVLSPAALNSAWVQQELQWAMDIEHAGSQVKVLPLIAEACEVPSFLENKIRLDFSTPEARRVGLLALSRRLGGDVFRMTGRLFPLLGIIAAESQQGGVRPSTVDAIASARFPAEVLEPFLDNAIKHSSADGLVGLAHLCMVLVDQSDCCFAAAELAMRDPRYPMTGISALASSSLELKRVQAITWWHDTFVDIFHDDVAYCTLLQSQGSILLRDHYDSVASYLLYPDRGPDRRNIESLLTALRVTDRPAPFVQRWLDWLYAGRFDGMHFAGDTSPTLHYIYLVEGIQIVPQAMEPIVDASIDRVRGMLKSSEERDVEVGIMHLDAMIASRVPFAERVRTEILARVYSNRLDDEIRAMDSKFRMLGHEADNGD